MLLCLLCTISCTQEEIWNAGNQDYAGKPIQITVSGPDNNAISRAAKDPKKEFKKGDIIHISTAFTYAVGTVADQASVVYSCLTYNGSSWTETDTKTFTWPWNAEKATFTAYYIPAAGSYTNSSFMKPGDVPINLSDLSNSDPLYATHTDVVAGGSVYLQFNHLLTKVTFTNMEKEKVTKGQELRLVAGCDDQMTFTRVEKTEDDKTTDQLVHTSSQAAGYITSQCEENSSILECTFLVPAITTKSTIKLANKDMSPYHSLELPEDLLPKGLEAGKHYIIDVTKLADNFISDAVKEEDWNTDTAVKLDADNVKKYLESIRDGEECSVEIDGKNTQILVTYKEMIDGQEKDVVAQIRDVEFNIVEGSFTPVNIRQNIIFQGNGHKISTVKITNTIQDDSYPDVPSPKGVACKALFGKNNGTIKNLIIEDASIEVGSTQEAYAAILTGQNGGTIENVTIKNVEIKVTSATQIGSLAGANSYIVSNCQITGKVSITIEQSAQNALCYIGGLVGYASGESKITNCSINAANTEKQISIKGSYQNCFAGGIAGFIENKSESCATNLNLTINADNVSDVTKLYAGGFAGQAKGTISKATATGNISIPTTLNKDIYIGGFTGELQNGTLDDCAANGNITCAESLSTAGGMVGNMYAYTAPTAITYSSATGAITTGIGGMVGTATKGTGTLSISNSFCINNAAQFIASGENVTLENCHQNGIVVGENTSFTPAGETTRWTNTPAIYGKDTKDAAIYYLKRNL